jgi:Ca-activated chloride channel family protein
MMNKKFIFGILALLFTLITSACSQIPQILPVNSPPRNAVVIEVHANTALQPWLEEAVIEFNNSKTLTAGERPVFVYMFYEEAGQAAVNIGEQSSQPSIWIPDTNVWTEIAAQRGNDAFTSDCIDVARSPLVIAMWQPIAESLGWPGRPLGWLDIGSIAADEGHTHPGLSATGSSTLLAMVQAAQSKTDRVTVSDIEQPIVQASVVAFEGAVSWFSKDTNDLGATMNERGASYLGASVVYENVALEYGQGDTKIVPIYPYEGTFMANHPACVNKGAGIEQQEAALIFRNYLLDVPAQQKAMSHYLRPTNSLVPLAAPMDEAHFSRASGNRLASRSTW